MSPRPTATCSVRRAPRRRYLGRTPAGTERTELPTRRHHRRFRRGLRAGQAEALPDVPCRGDVFHALQTATPLVGYLENRAYEAIATRSRLENRQARGEHRQGRKDASLVGQLRYAREAEGAGGDPRRRRGPVGPLAPARRGWRCAASTTSAAVPCMTGSWRNCGCASRTAPTAFDRSAVCWRINGTPCWPSRNNLDGDLQALAEEFAVPATLVEEVRDAS